MAGKFTRYWLAGVLTLGGWATLRAGEEPVGLLLTWQTDPTTTMTIDWHVEESVPGDSAAVLRFKPAGSDEWAAREAVSVEFPYSRRQVRRVELTDLTPGAEYRFTVGDFERQYRFRTMPSELDGPLVFATAGDTRHAHDWIRLMRYVIDEYDPAFALWSAPKAYYGNRPEGSLERWETWFEVAKRALVDADGNVLPIVANITSQEVRFPVGAAGVATDEIREEAAPFFYSLFAYPGQPGYGVLDFGDYLSLIALDTETNVIDGEQSDWLEKRLAERRRVSHVIPHYYLAGFPSDRDLYERNWEVREEWAPLFERNGIRLVFEESDMTYKRTSPIRAGRPDPHGVTYLGSGSWGAGGRTRYDPAVSWYLERAEPSYYSIVVTLDQGRESYAVVNMHREVIDEYPGTDEKSPKLLGLGLGSSEAFVGWIARLLGETNEEERAAGAELLEVFARHYDAGRPGDRAAFLEDVYSFFESEDVSEEKRHVAYQILLIHVEGSESAREWLDRGMADRSARIRALARTVDESDLRTAEGRLLLQTVGESHVLEMRERAFARKTNRPLSESGGEDFETAWEFEFPAEGWRFRKDPWRVGHLKGWPDSADDETDWMEVETGIHWHHFLGEQYQGVGWYRREVEIPAMGDYDALALWFDGVEENAWVWIDGRFAGQHNIGPDGWNIPFQVDATDLIRPGETHQITVRVMNQRSVGGIWNTVRLWAGEQKP